jgi:hypothetical protein
MTECMAVLPGLTVTLPSGWQSGTDPTIGIM